MTAEASGAAPSTAALGDRIAGAVLALLAVAAWWHAQTFVSGFRQPVGPDLFPRLVCVPLGVLALYLMCRPGLNQRWPRGVALLRQAGLLVVLGGYAGFLESWGFLPATLVGSVLLIRLFDAAWRQALVSGVSLTVILYLLFEYALGIPLPAVPGLGV
ncbi:tripartite tricarboxylate transporter TctB family protein [Salinicola acroporae]|uniref:Tripartite tricarboxylate transporter TctB family protein n=1 Tax=Salinicola acroporae TaxID=1541440 RepID=A0ABT6I3V9_9GAMM|nr:tripartite tricarboxylate transporter TctB family protein [Salinicola acroporae]MDH4571955.1 tripartite tricarboxylate transporter TctB family protein [Salinicola acroporae]